MSSESGSDLSKIPSVERVKQSPGVSKLLRDLSDEFVTQIAREVLDEIRTVARSGKKAASIDLSVIEKEVVERAHARLAHPLSRVINATGVVIHTNLGRSILGERVISAMKEAAGHYCSLEINMETGERGHRDTIIEPLICAVTGAEAATVVNNNAAAVMLTLDTLARGREVIVSRGELVEIGGSFRIPDVMEKSGAKLVEVGTTNKTYIYDYERALTQETSLLLKVHSSNYKVIGFTAHVELSELSELGQKRGIPVMEDLGSGALVDVGSFGILDEPTPQTSVKAGADVITFSCDKLLGGPQAGIIIGKREYIKAIRKNPLMRALRVDKVTLSALGEIFQIMLSCRRPEREIPTLGMLARTTDEILKMAKKVFKGLDTDTREALGAEIADGESQTGGGSCPEQALPTKLLVMRPKDISLDKLARRLRKGTPPLLGIIRKDTFCLDFRTVQPDELPEIITALRDTIPT